ncbi:murein L,D-transpeptidase catalytic domain family protein [Halomonas campisalis]|uniref:Murein L,D-transpeptidase catalytic domain family protein n=1 Tax=Billgrantia campisalis TaxID=74661 RepID=A0ABS9PC28_9GAMM|nr:murein L,D-transpeptidase catalytic domain family protein [Halomonas campisalis]MCG6659323.1 murein L,D-transpeptidase catalytic domain family protein [Halomonas campisalis]MDR5863925.1 murein L,D-transpeptidase catalytic domain family protein [Halomonas campisalis]
MPRTRPLSPLPLATLAASLLLIPPSLLADDFLAQALHPDQHTRHTLDNTLTRLAPAADQQVLGLAARALACAEPDAERLAVIDYSRPSTEPRLWVFDLAEQELLFEELVSHGRGSGDAEATVFSNTPESYQSSLGLFRTMNTYYGRNGYSLRLEGLEAGINDLAYQRAIVIHGADYVSDAFIEQTGRLGRSHGCPAVRQEVTYPLIDSIKEEQYLFVYYPDQQWLNSSAFLDCQRESRQLAMQ